MAIKSWFLLVDYDYAVFPIGASPLHDIFMVL